MSLFRFEISEVGVTSQHEDNKNEHYSFESSRENEENNWGKYDDNLIQHFNQDPNKYYKDHM